jgi:hypothetical protein
VRLLRVTCAVLGTARNGAMIAVGHHCLLGVWVVLVAVDVRVFRVLPETHTPWKVAVVTAEVGSDEAATEHHSPTEPGPPEIPVAGWVIQPENVFEAVRHLLASANK